MAGRIFISYRRDDTAADARSVYQRMQRAFGSARLFMDVDSIQRGRDFHKVLDDHLRKSAVMLAVIGPRWLDARDVEGKRRLEDPDDFIRLEVARGLKRDIPVVPLLVGGARMPKASDLPDDLRGLARRQGITVTHENFSSDMDALEKDLHALLRRPKVWRLMAASSAALAVAALVSAYYLGVSLPWLSTKPERQASTTNDKAKKQAHDAAQAKSRAEAKRNRQERQAAEKKAAEEKAQSEEYFQEAERLRVGRGVPRDYARARELDEKAAAMGHVGAMVSLGWLYRNGFGGPQDYGKAREWHEKAAAAGNAGGTNGLGWLYRNGWGVPRDYVKARDLFEKAAAGNHPDAMNNLGNLYEHGAGVPKDHDKAREWYEKAAAAGSEFGMNNLGRAYQNGWGGPRDLAKAREWFEKGVAGGNKFAKANLARMLDQKQGGPVDYPRAAKLLLQAALDHNEFAITDLSGDMGGWSGSTRMELKRELARLGHYNGSIDHQWLDDSRAAFKKYLDVAK